MPIQRLNHAVLYVRDATRTAAFYQDLLGFRPVNEVGGSAVFLQAPGSTNDHDLGVFSIGDAAGPSAAGRTTVGLYHLAWEVDTLEELERIAAVLSSAGSLVGASNHGVSKSLYAKDPDGIEFEVAWLVPADLLTAPDHAVTRPLPLDIQAEKARYGATTLGGIGVSTPVTA